jgi:hypothetical protein
VKPDRIFTEMINRKSYSYRKTSEALEIYNFFLNNMAPDTRMKTVFKMKDKNTTYEEISEFLCMELDEVIRLHKSSYELLANIFISLEIDDYINENQLFDDQDNDVLFKKVYRKVLNLNKKKGVEKNAKKKKRRTNHNSERLFGDLL